MRDDEFLKKISSSPSLRERFEEILDIANNTEGQAVTADEAEELAIEAVRKLGKEVLQEWSSKRLGELDCEYEKREDFEREVKKNFTGTVALELSK